MSSFSAHAMGARKHTLYFGSKAAVEAFARCVATGKKTLYVRIMASYSPVNRILRQEDYGQYYRVTTEATRKYIHRLEGGPNEQWRWSKENAEEVVATFMPLHTAVVLDVVARVPAFLASEDGCLTNGKTNRSVRSI
jgi:NAD(P)-dependent dehydrogenase (short-subunit alcohol dehydrogenase family)